MTTDRLLRLQTGISPIDPTKIGFVLSVTTATLPDGRVVIVAGSGDGTVQILDALTGEPIEGVVTGATGPLWSMAATTLADGRAVVFSGGADGTVRRFDAATGVPMGQPIVGHSGRVLASGRHAA